MSDGGSAAAQLLGIPRAGGVLLVGDHASNHVPAGIDLGIDAALLNRHIAHDIGVAGVARRLVDAGAVDAAWLGAVSRLVVDCNRDEQAPGAIPAASDGMAIPGNHLSAAQRAERLARFHHRYHAGLDRLIDAAPPACIVSLHSFTPTLASDAAPRPWHVGILYNVDDRLARLAIPAFAALGLTVGDQQPYSGRDLNYTMDRHAEARGIPYLGIEMRQDRVADVPGQRHFAAMIGQIIADCRRHVLGSVADPA